MQYQQARQAAQLDLLGAPGGRLALAAYGPLVAIERFFGAKIVNHIREPRRTVTVAAALKRQRQVPKWIPTERLVLAGAADYRRAHLADEQVDKRRIVHYFPVLGPGLLGRAGRPRRGRGRGPTPGPLAAGPIALLVDTVDQVAQEFLRVLLVVLGEFRLMAAREGVMKVARTQRHL